MDEWTGRWTDRWICMCIDTEVDRDRNIFIYRKKNIYIYITCEIGEKGSIEYFKWMHSLKLLKKIVRSLSQA